MFKAYAKYIMNNTELNNNIDWERERREKAKREGREREWMRENERERERERENTSEILYYCNPDY